MWLWHKLFNLARIAWDSPRSTEDLFIITFRGFGNSSRGKTLWKIACLSLVWFVWKERNARIFENKERVEREVWDLFYFDSSLWVSCTKAFRGIPLSVVQLDWAVVCNSSS